MTQDIETESAAYKAMKQHYTLADDLEAGTFRMRERGQTWLPPFRGEESEEYDWRLKNAFCKPMLRRATDLIVGHMFREGLDKSDLKADDFIIEDFDLLGNSIDDYAAKVASTLLTRGVAHTYTDFPKASGGERTLADEIEGKVRPYAISISPKDLFFAVPGKQAQSVIDARWHAASSEADGMGEAEFTEIRRVFVAQEQVVFEVGQEKVTLPAGTLAFQVWRQVGESGWTVDRYGILKGVSAIPLRTAYSEYQGFMRSTPTLEAVAAKNLEHWQASSDHNSIVQMVRFPMFYATGVQQDEADHIKVLGPRVKLISTNEQAKFGYAETSGAAVEQSFKDLERISREADERSVEALYKAGSDTATGRTIDLMESLSPAQRVAKETERHVNQVLNDFGAWSGKDYGRINVDLDFGFGENEQMIIDALQKARAMGDVPRTYYLKRLQELGAIGDDVKPEELAAEADNEAAERGLNSQFGDDPLDAQDPPNNQKEDPNADPDAA